MSRKMLIVTAALLGMSGVSHAQNNLLFILDASNSMWGQVDGTAKIDTAKSAFGALVGQLPAGTNIGLMAYGHRDSSSCSDIEVLAPIGATPDRVRQAVQAISPRGKTPIAASLQQSWDAFIGSEEQTNSVVLISDGIETCEGDPCATAAELVQRGVNVRVHVVGFDVDAEAREQLECIAENGGGQYFSADSTEGFSDAVTEAVQVAQIEPEPAPAPEPEPVETSPTIYFEDEFESEGLGPDWEIVNPNPDAYLVESGVLTLLAPDGTPATYTEAQNIFRLSKPIPQGDWTMTARILFTPQTMGENIRIGVAKDGENFLLTSLQLSNVNYRTTQINVRSDKLSGGEETGFARTIHSISDRYVELRSAQFTEKVKAVQFRLEKAGRQYVSAVRLESTNPGTEGAVNEDWQTVQQLTSLRPPGDAFIIMFGSNSNNYTPSGGEGLIEVDWVRIEVNE